MEAVSTREAEVLSLVGEGLTNAQIGARLFISVRTVESHVSALLRKLAVTDRRDLAAHVARATTIDGESVGATALVGAPESFTSFIGRASTIDQLTAALSERRLVTLTGPGGIGKTRLVLEAGAKRLAPPGWFVDLVPATPGHVTRTVAGALGATDRPGQTLLDVICETVAASPGLVVLDNCEHVLDEAAEVAGRLIAASPQVTVLATSREPLRVPGEQVVPIGPLELGGEGRPAIELFRDRAAAAGAVLGPAEDDVVADICRRLDGSPLAIELAAARCASLGADGVARALDDQFRLLQGGRGNTPRHRSVRAVLDWSHALLDDEEQALLRRLAVFSGDFSADDAVEVCDATFAPATLDALGRLAAKSLIVRRGDAGGTVFRLLDTVHAYAGERLDEAGEREAARSAHLAWALGRIAELEEQAAETGVIGRLFDRVADDIRAALEVEDDQRAAEVHELARRFGHLTYGRLYFDEARRCFDLAARTAPGDREAALTLTDAAQSAFALLLGDVGGSLFDAASERAEAAGDLDLAAITAALSVERRYRFSAEFAKPADHEDSRSRSERAHRLGAGGGPIVAASLALCEAWRTGPAPATSSLPMAEAALAAARAAGDPVLESDALDALAAGYWNEGRQTESARVCIERVALLDRLSPLDVRAGCEQLDILHMASDGPMALGDLPTGMDMARRAQHHPLAGGSLHVLERELVVALCLSGKFEEGLDRAERMRLVWERMGRPSAGWLAPATYLAALVHGVLGHRDESAEWFRTSEAVCLESSNAVRSFAHVRLALHEGRLDDGRQWLVARDRDNASVRSVDGGSPWSMTSLGYEAYLWAIAAEVWAARGEPDAAERIDSVAETYPEHLWARPCLDRARGRLDGDPELLRQAVAGFATVGAAFEVAVTQALLPGPDGESGRRALAALGCTPPG